MNEFAPYAMQAPPLKRRTRQRFTEIDNSSNFVYDILLLKLAKLLKMSTDYSQIIDSINN